MLRDIRLISDITVNDSNKDLFTVPDGEHYAVLWVHADVSASADVGNRRITLEVLSGATVIFRTWARQAQAAGTQYFYDFSSGSDAVAAANGVEHVPLPTGFVVPTGCILRVRDYNAIAAGADDMLLHAVVERV